VRDQHPAHDHPTHDRRLPRDPQAPGGRHELGQNFLADPRVIAAVLALVDGTRGPIVEIGPGDGALTIPLGRTGRPVTAVELDPRRARRLAGRAGPNVTVVHGDALRFRLPRVPHTVVGNVPFHLTTAILRRLLAAADWEHAVLLVQWEAARRRAGVGGATLLTASWWPWYVFELHSRVPARAFRPVPAVDGGLLAISRRERPLVADREPYQRFVKEVFAGRGCFLGEILPRTGRIDRPAALRWMRGEGIGTCALPKDLTARQWASLWHAVRT
jgi:23S rRNA (adenine-N6)-dimethyltransferase